MFAPIDIQAEREEGDSQKGHKRTCLGKRSSCLGLLSGDQALPLGRGLPPGKMTEFREDWKPPWSVPGAQLASLPSPGCHSVCRLSPGKAGVATVTEWTVWALGEEPGTVSSACCWESPETSQMAQRTSAWWECWPSRAGLPHTTAPQLLCCGARPLLPAPCLTPPSTILPSMPPGLPWGPPNPFDLSVSQEMKSSVKWGLS